MFTHIVNTVPDEREHLIDVNSFALVPRQGQKLVVQNWQLQTIWESYFSGETTIYTALQPQTCVYLLKFGLMHFYNVIWVTLKGKNQLCDWKFRNTSQKDLMS